MFDYRSVNTNEQRKKYQMLDGTTLKILAMLSMVLDHVGDMFFPGVTWLRMVGRLAMPIFSFCIAEGFAHTRDRKKYLCRMGIFALISEIPSLSKKSLMDFFDCACERVFCRKAKYEARKTRYHGFFGRSPIQFEAGLAPSSSPAALSRQRGHCF